jgi:hypothetical protein
VQLGIHQAWVNFHVFGTLGQRQQNRNAILTGADIRFIRAVFYHDALNAL